VPGNPVLDASRLSLRSPLGPFGMAEAGRRVDRLSELLGDASAAATGALLAGLSPLDRTRLVTLWATSPCVGRRLALARSFSSSVAAVGLRTAMDHLSRDGSAQVRSSIERAARSRDAKPVRARGITER